MDSKVQEIDSASEEQGMDETSDSECINGVHGVSNKELKQMCQGEWINDNVRPEYDVVYIRSRYIDPIFLL